MHCNAEGIGVNRVELIALIAFSSSEESDSDYYGVNFSIKGDRCFARSTDGKRAVEADGTAEGIWKNSEWFVFRDFLIACRKLLTGGQTARLIFNGASLHEAHIEGEDGDVSTLTWEKDAAMHKANFPEVEKFTKLPSSRREIAKCVTLAGPYLAALNMVAKAAASEGIDCYPPTNPRAPAVFQIGAGKHTVWTVSLMPQQSVATHTAETKGKDGKRTAQARQEGLFDGQGRELDPKTNKPLKAKGDEAKGNVSNIDDARKKAAKKPRKKARPKKKAPGKK